MVAFLRKHSLWWLGFLLLAGCSPTYNWREVRPADLPVSVMLPGKPSSLTQRIRLDGMDLVMSMTGAQADDQPFTVACVTLPDDQPGTAERVLAAMRAGMLRNIGGTEERAQAVTVRRIDPQGQARGERPGVQLVASGRAQGRPLRMHALFVADGRRACQLVALGADLPEDEVKVFVDSLKLIAR